MKLPAIFTFAFLSASLCFSGKTTFAAAPAPTGNTAKDTKTVNDEHAGIGLPTRTAIDTSSHNTHPDAQWYPDAALGLFIHWSPISVKGINIGWSMIDGLNNKPAQITPNDYWALAKKFNPTQCDMNKWLSAAHNAGFTYAVFTTRHHEGFAMWPSKFSDFSTSNYMNGRDLVKEYVEACRANGLKVGLYYSPPNWYFERDTKNFNFKKGPGDPFLGPDLKPKDPPKLSPDEKQKFEADYAAMVRGQLTELLTNYGKIDLLWFDGRPPIPNSADIMTIDEIRKLQPGIVMNGRLHGKGDFLTYERALKTDKVAATWAEYCNTWTDYWPHVNNAPFRAPAFILGQLAKSRSLGINYLPGVGPMANGEFTPEIYEQFKIVGDWMKTNGKAIKDARPLPPNESATVPATANLAAHTRYLFAIPQFTEGGMFKKDQLPAKDETLTLHFGTPTHIEKATLLSDNASLQFAETTTDITIPLPASRRSELPDVVELTLTK